MTEIGIAKLNPVAPLTSLRSALPWMPTSIGTGVGSPILLQVVVTKTPPPDIHPSVGAV